MPIFFSIKPSPQPSLQPISSAWQAFDGSPQPGMAAHHAAKGAMRSYVGKGSLHSQKIAATHCNSDEQEQSGYMA